MTHKPGTFYIAPVDNPKDQYRAGYDGNAFDTWDEAWEILLQVAEEFETEPDYWVIMQREPVAPTAQT